MNPDWIAFEAVKEMDPGRVSHPAIYEGAHLYCRHIAVGILGVADIGVGAEPDSEPTFSTLLQMDHSTGSRARGAHHQPCPGQAA